MAEFLPTFCNFALNRSSEVIEVSNPMFWGMGNSFPQSELQYLKQFPRWSKMVDFWPLIACIMITILNIAIVHIIKSLLEWQGTQCNNHTITAYRFFCFFVFISPTLILSTWRGDWHIKSCVVWLKESISEGSGIWGLQSSFLVRTIWCYHVKKCQIRH